MPSAVKEKFVEELVEELKTSKHVLVTEYQGMAAGEFDELRAQLRPLGAKYKVIKNRLAKLALTNSGWKGLEAYLKGPTAIAYLGADTTGITKAIFKFTEQHSNLKVKAGHAFGGIQDGKTLKTIANLPSKEVLLSILLSRLNSPLTTLLQTLQEPLRSLQSALSAVQKKKESVPA